MADKTSYSDIIARMVRDSALGRAMFEGRYGAPEAQPAVLAAAHAQEYGYPAPDSSQDVGEAQRYFATRRFAENHPTVGPTLARAANRLHEGVMSWIPGLGEGGTNIRRLDAGDQGVDDGSPGDGRKGSRSAPGQSDRPDHRRLEG